MAEGVIAHVFTTPRHVAEVTAPAVERGLGGIAEALHGLSVTRDPGRWRAMAARWGGLVDQVSLQLPDGVDPDAWAGAPAAVTAA